MTTTHRPRREFVMQWPNVVLLVHAAVLALPSGGSLPPSFPGPIPRPRSPPQPPPNGASPPLGVTRQAMIGHDDAINCLDAMPNRPILISGSDDGSARNAEMWDLRTMQCVLGFEARRSPGAQVTSVSSLAVSATHEHLLLAASGPAVLLFDMRMPAAGHPLMVQESATSFQDLFEHDICQISMHPTGSHVAAVDEGGGVSIIQLDANSGLGRQRVTRLATSHASLASSVRWRSPVPEFHGQLLTAGFDMKAMLHMLDAGLKKQSQPPVEYPMTAPVAVGGRRGGRAKTTCLRSGTADGEGLWGSAGRGGSTMVNPPFVYALEVTSDGRTLALGCGDGTLRTLGLNLDGSVEHLSTRCLQRHKRCVTCVAFPKISPQHRCLTGSDDRRVLLWNLAEPQHAKEDPLLLEIDHGLKPNWIYCTTAGYHLPGPHVFVADTSNVISTYTFRT